MNTAILEVLISVISSFLGVNLKDIKASLNKENLKTSEDNVISVSIDSVSKNLQDSKEIIENALLEIEKQKRLFEQMKQEAEISQQITTMNEAADMNMKIMYSHFQKHGYLLSDDEQKEIIKLIDVIDTITKSIIDISLGLQVYDVGNEENEDASVDKVHKKILERILKVTEFEETYYNLFKNNLSKLSK